MGSEHIPFVLDLQLASPTTSLIFIRNNLKNSSILADKEIIADKIINLIVKSLKMKVYKSEFSGSFYPSNPHTLESMIADFLSRTDESAFNRELFAVVVPHAGYIYSGQTASYAYKLLAKENPDFVIVMFPSHKFYFEGAFTISEGTFSNPLGSISIGSDITSKLIDNKLIFDKADLIVKEHSFDVQLPFIKTVLPNAAIVPLMICCDNLKIIDGIAEIMFEVLKSGNKKFVFVLSADLSHYHDYETASKLDKETIEAIMSLKNENMIPKHIETCGKNPIMTAVSLMNKLNIKSENTALLHYSNSGDVTKNFDEVVGYASIAVFKDSL